MNCKICNIELVLSPPDIDSAPYYYCPCESVPVYGGHYTVEFKYDSEETELPMWCDSSARIVCLEDLSASE